MAGGPVWGRTSRRASRRGPWEGSASRGPPGISKPTRGRNNNNNNNIITTGEQLRVHGVMSGRLPAIISENARVVTTETRAAGAGCARAPPPPDISHFGALKRRSQSGGPVF